MLSRLVKPLKKGSAVQAISSAVMLSSQAGYFCENHWYVSMTTADLNTLDRSKIKQRTEQQKCGFELFRNVVRSKISPFNLFFYIIFISSPLSLD